VSKEKVFINREAGTETFVRWTDPFDDALTFDVL
jgi:hypothetical protein